MSSEFFFYPCYHTNVKENSLSYYLFIAERIGGLIDFPRVLVWYVKCKDPCLVFGDCYATSTSMALKVKGKENGIVKLSSNTSWDFVLMPFGENYKLVSYS